MERWNVVIVGAGISGCCAAYELARAGAQVLVLEKGGDIAAGATRANSAVVHSGYDPEPGTCMALYNVQGNALIHARAWAWNLPFRQTGSLTVAFGAAEKAALQQLLERGRDNGVPGLAILPPEELYKKEPRVAAGASGALWAPTCAVIGPWELAIAHAENAAAHGACFLFGQEVTAIRRSGEGFAVTTSRGSYETDLVLNAAGTCADEVLAMAGGGGYTISPVKGEYFLLDKSAGDTVHSVLFSLPGEKGKGVLLAPTVHGNLIVGPSADPARDPEDTSTTAQGLAGVETAARRLVPEVPLNTSIRSFTGVRARPSTGDFVLGQRTDIPGFYEMGGMQSPGLTAAPAAACAVAEQMLAALGLAPVKEEEPVPAFCWPTPFRELPLAEQEALIARDPRYGRVICRCETVTEGEILRALRSPLTPPTVGAVKRRCGAGLGRCQGGFCGPRVQELIARERQIPLEDVCQENAGSWLLTGKTKGGQSDERS